MLAYLLGRIAARCGTVREGKEEVSYERTSSNIADMSDLHRVAETAAALAGRGRDARQPELEKLFNKLAGNL